MQIYKNKKGTGPLIIFSYIVLVNIVTFVLMKLIDTYTIMSLIKIFLGIFNIYELYYFLLTLTVTYIIDEDSIHIKGIWGLKNLSIPFETLQGYKTSKGLIKGVKLSGVGKNSFALGRVVIDKIGTTRMFVTNSKEVIYLRTEEINYAISPENIEELKKTLEKKNIEYLDWEHKPNRDINLHKQKRFMIPFILVSAIIVASIIMPLILYLKQMFPAEMPISFNSKFQAVKMGTGKQFAFKQMTYGALNMGILFCMYYAAHFHVRYDKRTAYRYIYFSLITSLAFFLMQIKTLIDYL
ncbi:PH domain-containing protein [Clostridium sp. MB40-C1]|uniref:PH domain-containing protein n=1 Tax=Clostridium sp. MB40-C1 TaxID=3070996 RepID=UPI0027E0B5CE|nr:PH domain-containing protein [Clostridium sp. MB40-C1]WMJ82296.1 PH domain-containing protein [Clostridium sp. MB40-C1]